MFKDLITIKLTAGNGGDGRVAFGRNYLPKGGTGGNGGSLYVEGSNNKYDLSSLSYSKEYKAENGAQGGVKNLTGKNGKDLVLKLPIKTKIYRGKELVAELSHHGQVELLLKGGIGGLGNHYFKRNAKYREEKFQFGKPGESMIATLELELQGDIIFTGLPNVGKSSILNALTNASSKVAVYPFTTLVPHLGRIENVTLMDLPGLIEGTSEGKGVGTSFIKHTRAVKLIAHFISSESIDPVKDYKIIRKELITMDSSLKDKPVVIIISKTDLCTKEDLEKKVKKLKRLNDRILLTSSYDLDSLDSLRKFFIKIC